MEELNKTQMVMLVLLVSFVTSIATGIITTSLLAEAPVGVTQTINRVVERTIQTVTPDSGSPREVSLKDEDRELLAVINKATQVVVHIEETVPSASSTPAILGVIVSADGLVVTGSEGIKKDTSYVAVMGNNTRIPLTLITLSEKGNSAVFKIEEENGGNSSVSAE